MNEAVRNIVKEDCKKSCSNVEAFAILRGQTILITGGTGFIGKWMVEMISYINSNTDFNIKIYLLARDTKSFANNFPHLAQLPNITLIDQDVKNINDLPVDVNYIIHAAGSPDNREHVSEPLKTVETFYKGTLNLLNSAVRLPDLKKIVHISSHQVYGKSEDIKPIHEQFQGKLETNAISQVYAESKRIAETLCAVFKNNFRLPVVILRPFAFLGPYQDLEKPWALNNFIRDGILGGPIRIIGNGSTVRSYLYGSDVAQWILKTLVNGQVGEIYNLGSSHGISLDDLAQEIKESIGGNIEIISKSSKEIYAYLSILVPDTSKASERLKVEETINLKEAINRTIIWNQLNRK